MMNFDFMLLAEAGKDIMIKDWETISKNTVEALKIMGMGLVAIFLVIAIIILAVAILNMVDNKGLRRKEAKATGETGASSENVVIPTAPKAIDTPKAIETSASVEPAKGTEVALDRREEGVYRKSQDVKNTSRYRKSSDDEDGLTETKNR